MAKSKVQKFAKKSTATIITVGGLALVLGLIIYVFSDRQRIYDKITDKVLGGNDKGSHKIGGTDGYHNGHHDGITDEAKSPDNSLSTTKKLIQLLLNQPRLKNHHNRRNSKDTSHKSKDTNTQTEYQKDTAPKNRYHTIYTPLPEITYVPTDAINVDKISPSSSRASQVFKDATREYLTKKTPKLTAGEKRFGKRSTKAQSILNAVKKYHSTPSKPNVSQPGRRPARGRNN